MTMEERLNAISIDKGNEGVTSQGDGRTPPKADAMAVLLAQGLQSSDKKILNVSFCVELGKLRYQVYILAYWAPGLPLTHLCCLA